MAVVQETRVHYCYSRLRPPDLAVIPKSGLRLSRCTQSCEEFFVTVELSNASSRTATDSVSLQVLRISESYVPLWCYSGFVQNLGSLGVAGGPAKGEVFFRNFLGGLWSISWGEMFVRKQWRNSSPKLDV